MMGYDVVASSDLSRAYDQSSWFFKKVDVERGRFPVMCVAPGGTDKLVLMRASDEVVRCVKQVINDTWTLGLQSEKREDVGKERLNEFKLRGNPWYGEGEESTMCRKLLLNLISALAAIKWRLLFATNLKGGTDSLFFIYDMNQAFVDPPALAMLSLNRNDRIRLLHFNRHIATVVKTVILRFYQTKAPDERDYYGALEYKLKGYPFASSGSEAIATRQLICRILEALRANGWRCKTTIDISRKMTDKSVLLFERCEPAELKFACLALSDVDRVRLINFPHQVCKKLRAGIEENYLPGFSSEQARDGQCYEIDLNGVPWTQNSSYNLHARSMLTMALKETSQYGWQLCASADVSAKYVHQENGPDYPIDVHSWFFCFNGVPKSTPLPDDYCSVPVSYAELKVADLEDTTATAPPSYDQAMQFRTS